MVNYSTIYVLKHTMQMNQELFDKLLKLVPNERRYFLIKQNFKKAQIHLLGDALVRYILCTKYNLNNSELIFNHSKYGKPLLKTMEDFHFNISHSKNWIVLAVDNFPIGIDIEILRDVNFKIAKRFYTNQEYNYILRTSGHDKTKRFYEVWTMKESYMKAIGKGFLLSPTSFDTLDFNDTTKIDGREYYFSKFFLRKLVLCTLCSTKKKVKIEYINDKILILNILNILEKEGKF